MSATTTIFSPLTLPCGRTLPNRLVKVAMYEHLAHILGGPPTDLHLALYEQWAKHNWGMVFTGNVQVSATHLTLGRDMLVPTSLDQSSVEPFRKLAKTIHSHESTVAIMQLNHSGRQSSNLLGGRWPFQSPLAPSPIPVRPKSSSAASKLFHWLLFQRPKEMSCEDIEEVVEAFVKGAQLAHLSGFDGIELHVAHGYLLAQFLSPKTNHRRDIYSYKTLHILHQILTRIRSSLPPTFILGLKLNASDYVGGVEDLALSHLLDMSGWEDVKLDFIEVSGGDYENPEFMSSHSPSPRQALFSEFSQRALHSLSDLPSRPMIILTGGLRSASLMHSALENGHADMLGIGRLSVVQPDLPTLLQAAENEGTWTMPSPIQRSWMPKIPLVGSGVEMAWYVVAIRNISLRRALPGYRMEGIWAVLHMNLWVPELNLKPLYFLVIGVIFVSIQAY